MNREAVRDLRRKAAIERLKSRNRNQSRRRGEASGRFMHPSKGIKPLMKNVVEVKMIEGKAVYNIERHDYYKERD